MTYRSLPSSLIPALGERAKIPVYGQSQMCVNVKAPYSTEAIPLFVNAEEGVPTTLHTAEEYNAPRFVDSELAGDVAELTITLTPKALAQLDKGSRGGSASHLMTQSNTMELPMTLEMIQAQLSGKIKVKVSSGIKLGSDTRIICVHDFEATRIIQLDPLAKSIPVPKKGKFRIVLRITLNNRIGTDFSLAKDIMVVNDAFGVTIMMLNSLKPSLKPTGQPWLPVEVLLSSPNYENLLTIANRTEDGEMPDEQASLMAASVDSWSMLPLTLRDHPSLEAVTQLGRERESITKMGLELEDVENLYILQGDRIKRHHETTFGMILALFAGEDLTRITNVARFA
jgi:hypothetical protein